MRLLILENKMSLYTLEEGKERISFTSNGLKSTCMLPQTA